MAFQNVKTPLVTKNGVNYNLQYDSTTGYAQIIQQNAPPGTQPIYQDGKWNSSATTLGFSNNEKDSLHQQTIAAVQSAYRSIGGVGSGAKLPQWASQNFTTNSPGQTSITPSKPVSGTIGGTGSGGVGELIGFLQNPAESYKNYASNGDKFGVGNEKTLFGKNMLYPIDLMTSQQDYFVISQYVYKPSKADTIFGGKQSAIATLKSGLQPGSNLEDIVGTVFLPMPNTIADMNNVQWGNDSMSNLAAAATANTLGSLGTQTAISLFGAGLGAATGGSFKEMAGKALQTANFAELVTSGAVSQELATLIGSEMTSKLLKLQGFEVESESILARGAGIVPNSNLEYLFQSPMLRQFTFAYKLSPRSAEEAATVRRIIRFFKQGMAAKKISGKSGQSSYFLGTPNVFKLEYKSGVKSIDGVNKFKTCALTSFQCNYTPDNLWAAYDEGQPVSTTMTLSFNELEPIYDTDYQEGNIFDGRNDLSSVSSNSVGY